MARRNRPAEKARRRAARAASAARWDRCVLHRNGWVMSLRGVRLVRIGAGARLIWVRRGGNQEAPAAA